MQFAVTDINMPAAPATLGTELPTTQDLFSDESDGDVNGDAEASNDQSA